jgi:probable rRNA maturation factor
VPSPPWLAHPEVSVLLADDATVRKLNADYRGKDRATDVLSFPTFDNVLDEAPEHASPGSLPLGDIVLALETIQAEAVAAGTPFSDHVSHLVVHGCLHLLGYDHQTADDGERMEGLERGILAQLGIPDPYAGAVGPAAPAAAGEPPAERRS